MLVEGSGGIDVVVVVSFFFCRAVLEGYETECGAYDPEAAKKSPQKDRTSLRTPNLVRFSVVNNLRGSSTQGLTG